MPNNLEAEIQSELEEAVAKHDLEKVEHLIYNHLLSSKWKLGATTMFIFTINDTPALQAVISGYGSKAKIKFTDLMDCHNFCHINIS